MIEGPYLQVYPGGMGGQKTAYAVLDAQKILHGAPHLGSIKAFKPIESVRAGIDDGINKEKIISRSGAYLDKAILIPRFNAKEILNHIERGDFLVVIDECHMFENLKPVIEQLLNQRKIVFASFLINDYGDRMFETAKYLLSKADKCNRFYFGTCSVPGCTRPASHSQIFIDGIIPDYTGPEIRTGDISTEAKTKYEPRCGLHYIQK
jgi:thymidine kinase